MLLIVSLILIVAVAGGLILIILANWFRDAADRTDAQMAKQAGDIANLRVENARQAGDIANLRFENAHQAEAMASLEEKVTELNRRRSKQLHSDETLDGIDDATAILTDILLRKQAQEAYERTRLDSLRAVLGEVRKGPHAYDSDRPAGMRSEAQP